MTKAPLLVGYVCFQEDAFERFTRRLAFVFESFVQKTVKAGPVIKSSYRATLRAFCRMIDDIPARTRRSGWFLHQAAAAIVAHKCRISSSTSAGFSTV